ncbi:hypothetical protein THAOC_34812 [Thalassiosira oceanica]|uniref:Uncharacterized protein n=1 Tax=Thalassiosira oceanica TaxID=159749 RepID=K0RIK9_THAOC|nr:hypothetical protein THAOC_34812 [Thalassiosira oceanica]|eukprot:EJK46517.1 hypothetical protein THAOC_34812 [Thalassiosira oceanica]
MFVCDFSLSLPRQVWGDAASANNLFVLTKMQGAQNGRRTLSNHSLVLALVSLYLSPLPFCQVAGVESSCLRRCLFVSGLTGMMYYRSVGQRSQAAARSCSLFRNGWLGLGLGVALFVSGGGSQTIAPTRVTCRIRLLARYNPDHDYYLGNRNIRRDRRRPRPVLRPDQVLPRQFHAGQADPVLPSLPWTDESAAVEIPMSEKSIRVARLRCLGWIFVLATLVALMAILFGGDGGPLTAAVVYFVLACGFLCLVMKHGSLHYASHERAVELCSALGPDGGAALRRLVDLNFQQRFETVAQDDNGGDEEGGGLGEGKVSEDLEFAEFPPSDGAAPDDKRKTDGGEQLPTAKILEAVFEVV